MPCELITAPTGGAPLSNVDYDAQNNYIQSAINKLLSNQLHLTQWDTLTVPKIKESVYIQQGGALFQQKDENYTITGAPGNGRVYIKSTRTGDELDFAFVNSAAGYSWNYIYNGFYHTDGTQLLPYVLYKTASGYHKYTLDNSENEFDITAQLWLKFEETIGTWDMDATPNIEVDFNDILIQLKSDLSAENFVNHVFVKRVNILNDDKNTIYYLERQGDGRVEIYITDEVFNLIRTAGGGYDNVQYNDGTMNRGYIFYIIII